MATQRKQTNSNDSPDWSLSEQQMTAIDLLVTGKNLQDTADLVGVQRPTVSQWVNHNPAFQAALNQRRQELWRELVEGLRALAPQAIAVLARALQGEDALQAAIHVLKSIGLYGMALPTGPTVPEEIAAHMLVANDAREHAAEEAEAAIKRNAYDRLLIPLTAP